MRKNKEKLRSKKEIHMLIKENYKASPRPVFYKRKSGNKRSFPRQSIVFLKISRK